MQGCHKQERGKQPSGLDSAESIPTSCQSHQWLQKGTTSCKGMAKQHLSARTLDSVSSLAPCVTQGGSQRTQPLL